MEAHEEYGVCSTGISNLDHMLGGGINYSSVVCIEADPGFMSELFLYHLASTNRVYYLTTVRRAEDVKRNMEDAGLDTNDITFADTTRARYFIDSTMKDIKANEKGVTIIIDTFSFFLNEINDIDKIRKLLGFIHDVTVSTGSITYLNVYRNTHSKDIENMLFSTCDVVFAIEPQRSGESLLSVQKARGMLVQSKFIILEKEFQSRSKGQSTYIVR